MKRLISLEGLIGIVFCIVAALGAMLAENKRLSILAEQDAGHAAAAASSAARWSENTPPAHAQSFGSGL